MKPIEICKEHAEQNGTKPIPYLLYGDFTHPAETRTDPIGLIGERNKK